MVISGRVTGLQGIKATLAAMPTIVRDRLGEAIRVTASEMVRDARGRVQVKTGTLQEHIDFSFSPTYASARVGITPGTVVIRADGELQSFKKVGRVAARILKAHGWKLYRASHYAHLVEFGWGHAPAHPFLGPAFAASKGPLDARMIAAQHASIDDLAHIGSSTL
jgi:HK97 gp10 family phage protein